MTFEESVATQPLAVQYWMNWMGLVIIASFIVLLFSKETRRDSFIILITSVAIFLIMSWLFQQIGFVRLLGIVHLFIWTPLVVYFWQRLKNPLIDFPFRQVIWIFIATIVISLLFDTADVIRYVLGERASLVPGS